MNLPIMMMDHCMIVFERPVTDGDRRDGFDSG